MTPGEAMGPEATASDVGLAAERTRLSWRRTTLSAAAVVLLAAAHVLGGHPTPAALAAIALMATVWLVILAVAQRRISALGRRATAGATPATVALLATGYAVLGLLVIIR
jgi:hypothetical protein